MKPPTREKHRTEKPNLHGEVPKWLLIACGALLSTLSARVVSFLKPALDTKQGEKVENGLKGKGKPSDKRNSVGYCMHSNAYSFVKDDDGCFNCNQGHAGMAGMKLQQPNGQIFTEPDALLPLVTVSAPEFIKENGMFWAPSSSDQQERPSKPFQQSNSSDSPCVSESGSDIFSKREVIQKLRQQVRRRDEMIAEMQDQITELQRSVNAEVAHSSHLQSLLDAANQEVFESEREVQRLRKVIADHCVNGYVKGEGDRAEMLRREVGELKEVIEGKEFLVRSYKEEKAELSRKMRELQSRLDSQLPCIL